jgi:hypothetical protein
MNADERRLLLDLVVTALGVLETGAKLSSRYIALTRVLRTKGIVTAEEIEKVEQTYDRIGLLSEDPRHVAFVENWNMIKQRLEAARRRLSEEEA